MFERVRARAVAPIMQWYKDMPEAFSYVVSQFVAATAILLDMGGQEGLELVRDVYGRCDSRKREDIRAVLGERSADVRDFIVDEGDSNGWIGSSI